GFHWNYLKTEAPVSLFMDPFKTQSFIETDPPLFSRCDEAKVSNEEDASLIDCFSFYPLEFAHKKSGKRIPKIDRQGSRADGTAVVKLNIVRLMRRANLTLLLKISDDINKRGISPGFGCAPSLSRRDNVGGSLFNYAEPIEF